MADKQQCCVNVYPREHFGSFHGYQCTKPAKVTRDGKKYCGLHDPVAVKTKDAERNRKWEEENKKAEEKNLRHRFITALCDGIPTDELDQYELRKKDGQ